MGAAIPYVHSKGRKTNSIVMCPSHLVEKWKREIDERVPNSETIILNDYIDVINIEDKIRDKNKEKSLYMIVSKDKAKSNYDKRPAVLWDRRLKTFRCPECGEVLYKRENKVITEFEPMDMSNELVFNSVCSNHLMNDNNKCRAKLWTVLNKDEEIDWYKITSVGWVHEESIDEVINLYDIFGTKTKKDRNILSGLRKLKIDLDNGKEVDRFFRASSKYSISTYIRNNLKNEIDYLIADEVHLLKGESLQGESFGDLVKSSKKTIALTGTLLNGYADSIFYTLYRTLPRTMVNEGFEYNDIQSFTDQYGVYSDTIEYNSSNNNRSKRKKLPGISPVIFTKFLLENSVFLSLSDMSEGLPGYKEIPIGVDLDPLVANQYEEIQGSFRKNVKIAKGLGLSTQYLQLLSVYPDEPFDNDDIYNRDSGDLIFEVPDMMKINPNYTDNKINKFLEITTEKVNNGERVLVYISWTNKTNNAEKIKEELTSRGINAEILRNVAPDKREAWIDKKVEEGMQVMICNPTLVETGLDLLDFTTIIFYQLGYNIFTMRQASRRSWRLSQEKDIEVYFLYYKNTVQEQTLSLMASKLKASMAIEGKFSEEGLRAMSDNTDLMSEIANSVINGVEERVSVDSFSSELNRNDNENIKRYRRRRLNFLKEPYFGGLNQKKDHSRRKFESLMKDPIKVVNMM